MPSPQTSILPVLAALLMLTGLARAEANWLSRLVRSASEIGEGGAKAVRHGLGALEDAAGVVARLPPAGKGVALAAHATPEGHWKFVNRDGEVFTAGNAAELARVRTALAPGADAEGKLSLYLSEDTVFRNRAQIKELPDADLHIVSRGAAYPLVRRGGAGGEALAALVRPNVAVTLTEPALYRETLHFLDRPLKRAGVRIFALEPGGPRTLSSTPLLDAARERALVDRIEPGALASALGTIKGQTVLVTGRIEGDLLTFRPASGAEERLSIGSLLRAAEAADVNVIVLDAAQARQPGGRNWLWQTVSVAGLDEALRRATFADFLATLGGGYNLGVTATRSSAGRVSLSVLPEAEAGLPLSETVSHWLGEVTGSIAVRAVNVHARDEARERELDQRIIPGVPSEVQLAYLAGLVLGLMGLVVARGWWTRLWPAEDRREYRARAGYHAARIVRGAAFVLIFLPLAGLPAFLWTVALKAGAILMAPFRLIGRLRNRLAARAG